MTVPVFAGTFKLDRSRHASVQVFEHLRELIVTLELKPGTVLARSDLTNYFGFSQTPVRDALLRLEEEQLVEIFPQHGTRVRAIDVDSARQVQFLRMALELEIVRTLALEHEPALIPMLHDLLTQQENCLKRSDLKGFGKADQAFHHQLYTAARMDDLWATMRARSGNIDRLRRLHLPLQGKGETILADHAHIIDAISRRDPDAAVALVRKHLSGTLSELNTLREKYPEYLIVA